MQRSLNRVTLMGIVGRDPEMRHTSGGVPVTSFSVATTRRWQTPEGTTDEATDWFNVIAWHRLAEICHSHVRRGDRVYLEGRLETRAWQEPGLPVQYRTEVVATDVIFLNDAGAAATAPDHDDEYAGY